MSRYHVRCSNRNCRARQVLSMHPDAYKRPRKCWSCGRTKWTIDPFMTKRNTRAMGCMCAGYAWGGVMSGAMHRRGSLHCWYETNGTLRVLTDEQIADYS